MFPSFKSLAFNLIALVVIGAAGPVAAAGKDNGNMNPQPCPVAPYNGVPMDIEFNGDAQANTQCLRVRNGAKVLISVSRAFTTNAFNQVQTGKPTFFGNLDHFIRNYENVHGMTIGKDVEVAVVLSESGAVLSALSHGVFKTAYGNSANPWVADVQRALDKGVKIYLCQTAARTLGITMPNMIPGIQFVPGGHIAVADFQLQGYALIQP